MKEKTKNTLHFCLSFSLEFFFKTLSFLGRALRSQVFFIAVALLCLSIQILNLQIKREQGDGTQILASSIVLAHTNRYQQSLDHAPYSKREPLIPFLLAGLQKALPFLGVEALPIECALRNFDISVPSIHMNQAHCYERYSYYRIINPIFLIGAAVLAYFLVLQFFKSVTLAYLVFFLTAFQGRSVYNLSRFLTEPATTFFILLVSFLLYRALTKSLQSQTSGKLGKHFFWVGISLACLSLCKAIFHYLWLVIPLYLVTLSFWDTRLNSRQFRIKAPLYLLGGYFLLAGSWMARNAYNGQGWVICYGRAAGALSIRARYSDMTEKEKWAAWRHFSTFYSEAELLELAKEKGYTAADISNIFRNNPNGYYQRSSLTKNETLGQDPASIAQFQKQQIYKILHRPWHYLELSALFAWRGLFMQDTWGWKSPDNLPTVGKNLSIDLGSFGYRFNKYQKFYVNLFCFLCFLLLPLFLLSKKRWAELGFFMPALFSHAIYSLASQFLPRYGVPEIPVILIATTFSLHLILKPMGQRLAQMKLEYFG